MKSVIILYDQPLSFVQGINYVNNSFVQGQDVFKLYDLQLKHIVSPEGIFDVGKHKKLDLIGAGTNTAKYTFKKKIKRFFKSICSTKLLLFSWLKMYFGFIRYSKQAVGNLDKLDYSPDYIIFQDINTAYYYFKKGPLTAKTLLILHCSDDYLEQAKNMYPGYYRYSILEQHRRNQYEYVFSKVDKVVYLSEHAVKTSNLPGPKKSFVYNGIQDRPNNTVYGPGGIINFVCVGTVSAHKGQKLIIQALSYLDKSTLNRIHLNIIGGGDEVETCRSLARELKLESYITLYGSRNDVPELLRNMDVFILPSFSEGMPMSILEAMRQGLYILATDTGAIPEMIQPEFGQLITREPSEIAETIKDIIKDDRVSMMAKNASRMYFLEHFTLESMMAGYAKTLNEL